MKRFLIGFTIPGAAYLLMAFLALADESLQRIVGPPLRLMSAPISFIYDAFQLGDDDARVIYPIILSAAVWATIGGSATLLVARFTRRLEK